jgi:hypothetical protein
LLETFFDRGQSVALHSLTDGQSVALHSLTDGQSVALHCGASKIEGVE